MAIDTRQSSEAREGKQMTIHRISRRLHGLYETDTDQPFSDYFIIEKHGKKNWSWYTFVYEGGEKSEEERLKESYPVKRRANSLRSAVADIERTKNLTVLCDQLNTFVFGKPRLRGVLRTTRLPNGKHSAIR